MCDEFHSQHLPGNRLCLISTPSELHTAAFAAAARMDLGFDDDDVAAEMASDLGRFAGRHRDFAARHRDAEPR